MLKPQLHLSNSTEVPFLLHKPFIHGNFNASLPISMHSFCRKNKRIVRAGFTTNNIKAVASSEEKSICLKAIVTVKPSVYGLFLNLLERKPDDVQDFRDKALILQLVELDPETGLEKGTIKGYAHRTKGEVNGVVKYESSFEVPKDFGDVGAVFVENENVKEIYLQDIIIDGKNSDGLSYGPVHVNCNSWVHSKCDNPQQKRVFFSNKSYLPSRTPSGLRRLRETELEILQGNGQGERKSFERIYDYDVYNDIGDPDSSVDLKRPVLGGEEYPYPRRCRTGRPRSQTDPLSEKRSSSVYVPRDESFSDAKKIAFSVKSLHAAFHALLLSLETASDFPYFTAIDSLFNDGINLPRPKNQNIGFVSTLITGDHLSQFKTPETMDRDKLFWFRDDEFARQTLAGLNPYSIQLVTELPLKSQLDPSIYGPAESAITIEMIEREIKDFMTVDEAIKKKKLFILDYHDLLLPYVSKVREIKGTTLYGSRTLFFLTLDDTLRPLAIELTRPPMDGKPQWKNVYIPTRDATSVWLWRLAKAHVLAHDSGYHQLVSHWLRTHCATEPYIIATNRQLSVMHPIYRLLHPHFRDTMEINVLARKVLISAGGIIESSFSLGKYAIEFSSDAYKKQWKFNLQALPADLISRGMAVEDSNADHGLKLSIKDYPFANDGLLLWDAIKEWVSDYVNYYYPNPSLITSDQELQGWWNEIRTKGHADKKDEPWWPVLETPKDLIEIITTIVWVASGHHAAVNFGQYTYYGGYLPSRPTIARINMPTEEPSNEFWDNFLEKPEGALLKCFPSKIQAMNVMTILDVLSNHSPDEEYLGEKIKPAWTENETIKKAFEKFRNSLKELEVTIDRRNGDKNLKNRSGAGVVPYELLKPFSPPGVTGKGVPYSISI